MNLLILISCNDLSAAEVTSTALVPDCSIGMALSVLDIV